jgi:hypothetical protein
MAHRYCRRVIGAKHLRAAQLIVLDGYSGYRALIESGFSQWTARNFSRLLRECWALRAAIEMVQNETKTYLDPAKVRRRRYQRKPIVEAVQKYVAEPGDEWTNSGTRYFYEQERACGALEEGTPRFPVRCSVCRGPLEGKDHWCPNCQRVEKIRS